MHIPQVFSFALALLFVNKQSFSFENFSKGPQCLVVAGPKTGVPCNIPWGWGWYEKGDFYGCLYDEYTKEPWCEVESDGIYSKGNWGICNYNCPRKLEVQQGK